MEELEEYGELGEACWECGEEYDTIKCEWCEHHICIGHDHELEEGTMVYLCYGNYVETSPVYSRVFHPGGIPV